MTEHSIDVLAIAAHPDDVELWAGGTICSLTARGLAVGIIDLTQGELGSRGSVEERREEAAAAATIMGVRVRENLKIPDGNIENNLRNRLLLIQQIRRYRPTTVLVGAPVCRHPDHGAATELATASVFYAGLRKIETHDSVGTPQEPYRPDHVLHYMQSIPFDPTFVVDVSDFWDQRTRAVQAFKSQFFNADYEAKSDEPETYVSNPAFFEWTEARARSYGYPIGAQFAEPFLYRNGPVGLDDLTSVLARKRTFK